MLRRVVCDVLRQNGYHPVAASNGREALERMEAEYVDLIVSDIMMPEMDGYELTESLRDAGYALPILMITAKEQYRDMEKGLSAGTDDYMVKPINLNEMLLRVKALLRRAKIASDRRITVGMTEVDCDSLTVANAETSVTLPQKEFQLLYRLLSYPDKIITRQQLMDEIWGYETSWGSFAQFCKVQAQQLLPKPKHLAWEEAASYGLTYFTAYRMLMDQAKLQPGHKVLIWGAAGGLGVFAVQLCKLAGADCVGVVSSFEKGELVKELGATGFIDRNDFAGMMRKGGETPEEEKARFGESRRFAKAVKEILGDAPDIVFEHVGKATFPTSVFAVKPFGKVVICGATSGYDLDFDVRYLWMRQKQIIGSHFANAWEANQANALIEESKIRPVLWKTMGFDGVAEAHQLLRDNKHLGKIAILVGASAEGQGRTAEGPGAIRAEVGA